MLSKRDTLKYLKRDGINDSVEKCIPHKYQSKEGWNSGYMIIRKSILFSQEILPRIKGTFHIDKGINFSKRHNHPK